MNTPDRLNEVLASGKTIGGGRYILNKPIGEHSNIWLAHDDVENKPSVLNFLPLEMCQDPRAMEELRNQVNILRDISHPNVGAVYELYEAEGEEAFISSEYIEGMNLGALQQMQPNRVFTWTFLLPLLKQIFSALEFAHQNKLVQGSLKPSSIMLDRKGQIKLLEVGVAGILNNPLYAGPPQMGVGGLLPYLSPQQIDGNPPTVTDDIYSLGITIYEFLTSTVPFNQGDLLPQIRNSQPETIEQRLAKLRISNPVPPIVSSMAMECLSKDPGTRPQDIQTLLRSLEVAELAPPPQAQPAPAPEPARPAPMPIARSESTAVEVLPPQRGLAEAKPIQQAKKPTMAIAIAVVVVLLGGAGAWFFLNKNKPSTGGGEGTQQGQQNPEQAELERGENQAVQAQPVQTQTPNPLPVVSVAETPEEKKARRLAMEAVELKTLSEKSGSGFKDLFNGRDLEGWKGDSKYWSVEGGTIMARTPNDAPAGLNSCLIWQGGNVGDFEFRFQFKPKLLKGNNKALGGVIYRGKKVRESDLNGYECRLEVGGANVGMLTSRDRMGMMSFTQKIVVKGDDKGADRVQANGDLISLSQVSKLIRKDEWNECVITAQGNHMTHAINGTVVADLIDDNPRKQQTSGYLGLMLNTGEGRTMQMEYRNLRLKRLSK